MLSFKIDLWLTCFRMLAVWLVNQSTSQFYYFLQLKIGQSISKFYKILQINYKFINKLVQLNGLVELEYN